MSRDVKDVSIKEDIRMNEYFLIDEVCVVQRVKVDPNISYIDKWFFLFEFY